MNIEHVTYTDHGEDIPHWWDGILTDLALLFALVGLVLVLIS